AGGLEAGFYFLPDGLYLSWDLATQLSHQKAGLRAKKERNGVRISVRWTVEDHLLATLLSSHGNVLVGAFGLLMVQNLALGSVDLDILTRPRILDLNDI